MGASPLPFFNMKFLRDKRDGDLWGYTPALATNPNMEVVEIFNSTHVDKSNIVKKKTKQKHWEKKLSEKAKELEKISKRI